MKYTIKRPELMNDVDTARYNPNVIIAILIAIVIYIAYALTNVIAGLVYAPIYWLSRSDMLQGSLNQMTDVMNDLGSSLDFVLMCLFLIGFLILFTIIEVRFIEKRPLSSIGLSKKRFVWKYLKGFGVGALLVIILLIPSVFSEWNNLTYNGFRSVALWFLFAFVVQTAGEEFVFRGYLLTSFGKKIGMFWAVMLSSLLFALLHITNGGQSILDIVTIFLIGTLLGFYMIRTNNLWGALGIHAAWNFVQGLFSDIHVSIMSMDYSVISVGGTQNDPQSYGIVGDPSLIVCIVVFLAAIGIVLFVGKNKIVVKKQISTGMETAQDVETGL